MKRKFEITQKQNQNSSSLIVFNTVVSKNNYNKGAVIKFFNLLVDKEDFLRKDREAVLRHTLSLIETKDTSKTQ